MMSQEANDLITRTGPKDGCGKLMRMYWQPAALVDELSLEDRINDEVRVILEAYSDEMQKSGANYQEMFRKVKTELVRKYKAVL